MSWSIDDLVSEMAPAELLAALFQLSDAAGLPISAQQPGEGARSVFSTFSTWGTTLFNKTIRRAIQAQYGDTVVDAGRTWATFWGLSNYGIAPDDALFAEGPVILRNTKGGNWSFAPGGFRVKNSLTSKTFVNLEQVTLTPYGGLPGVGPFPEQTVRFRADKPGSAATSTAGQIDALVTVADGVTCTNTQIIAGQDEEDLPSFVRRARGTPALLSPNGPKAAYETVLRRTLRADGSKVPVNRVRVGLPSGNGTVRAIVAGPSGSVMSSDVTRLLMACRTLCEPWGATAQVVSASSRIVNPVIEAYARSAPNISGEAIVKAGSAAVASFLASAQIGGDSLTGASSGYVFGDELAAIVSESYAAVYRAISTSWDVAIGAEEVPVAGTISITPIIVG